MAPINGWPLMGICNKLLPLPSDAIIQVRLVQPFGSYPVLPMAWDDMASRFLCEVWLRAASLVNSPCCGTHPAHAACTKRRSLGDKELQIPASSPLPLWGKGLWYAKKIAGDYRDLSWECTFTKSSVSYEPSIGRVSQVRGWELSCHHWYLEPWGGGILKEKIPEVRTSTPQMKGWNLKIIPKFLNEQEHDFFQASLISWVSAVRFLNGCTQRSGTTQNCCYLWAWCLDDQPARRESMVMIYRPNRRDYSCTKLLTYSTYKLHTSYTLLLILFQHCLPGIYNHNYTLKDQHGHWPWISTNKAFLGIVE